MLDALRSFSAAANDNPHVGRVVSRWDVDIVIRAVEREEVWVLQVRNGRIQHILPTEQLHSEVRQVELQGSFELLRSLFLGGVNPVRAASQGELAVYGEMTDQTKLDAIALILWGP